AVLSLGAIQTNVSKAIGSLDNPEQVAHFDMRFLHPLDKDCLQMVFDTFETVITIEDGVKTGGFGDAVLHVANAFSFQGKLVKLGIPDRFIEHGNIDELQEISGISPNKIKEVLEL